MGHLDDHIQQQASALLRDGEQLQAMGNAKSKNPTRDTYVEWLVGVTDQRLLFFPAKQTMTLAIKPTDSPPPFQLELRDVEHAWIKSGSVGVSGWRRFGMQPLKGRGARDLNGELITDQFKYPVQPQFENRIVLDVPPETKGLDGQQQFHESMPGWVVENVESRAFWGPEEHAALEEQKAEEARLEAEEARLQAEQAQKRDERREAALAVGKKSLSVAKKWGLLIAGALIALASLGPFGIALTDGLGGMQKWENEAACMADYQELLETNRSWIKAGKAPPNDCPSKDLVSEFSERDCSYHIVRDHECHLCYVYDKKPRTEPKSRKKFKRGSEVWYCPTDDSVLDDRLDHLEEMRSDDLESAESARDELILWSVVGVGLLLLGVILIGVGVFVRWRAAS